MFIKPKRNKNLTDIFYNFLRSLYSGLLRAEFRYRNKEYLLEGWKRDVDEFCNILEIKKRRVVEGLESLDSDFLEWEKKKNGKFLESFYLAAAIRKLQRKGQCENILEIGTGEGKNAILMARMAPSACVYTLDLPESDPAFRSLALSENEDELSDRISSYSNITLVLKNSLYLLKEDLPELFDLIWLDGGHHFPVVAWDFAFSYHRLRQGGILLMDDYVKESKYRNFITGKIPPNLPEVADLCHYVSPRIKEEIFIFPRYPLAKKYVAMIIKEGPDENGLQGN